MSFTVIPDLPALPPAGATGDDFNTPAIAFLTALREDFQPGLNTLADEFLTYVAAIYKGTSTTSVSVGTGSKSFTTQTGLGFIGGQSIIVSSRADAAKKMEGTVTSYNSGTGALVVNVATSGTPSGPYTDWDIGLNLASGGFLALTGGELSGYLNLNRADPRLVLIESDGASGYERTHLARDGNVVTLRTYSNGGTWVSTEWSVTLGAAGATTQTWRLGDVVKLTLNSSGLTVADGIVPRANMQTSITSPWPWNSDSYDQQGATAQANALTINADAGTPGDAQDTTFRVKDNGSARVLTFTGGVSKGFRDITGELTVSGSDFTFTTVASKTTYIAARYNSADSRWDIVGIRTQP